MSTFNANYIAKMLSEETVLMSIKVSKWGGTKADSTSAATLAEEYKGDVEGWGNASMRLLPKEMRSTLSKASQQVGSAMKQVGIPFMGGYLIRVDDYARVRVETDKEIAQLSLVIDEIIQQRPMLEMRAKETLGEKYYDGIIPPADEIREKFRHQVTVTSQELPQKLGSEDIERIKNESSSAFTEAFSAQVDLIKSLVSGLKEAVEAAMRGDKKKFRAGSHWAHIKEQIALVKRHSDVMPGLKEALEQVEMISGMLENINSTSVREDPKKGEALKSGVTGIESILADF